MRFCRPPRDVVVPWIAKVASIRTFVHWRLLPRYLLYLVFEGQGKREHRKSKGGKRAARHDKSLDSSDGQTTVAHRCFGAWMFGLTE